MRIKSPFKDYYDCMLAYDNESEPLFLRRTDTSYFLKYDCPVDIVRHMNLCDVIFFCGKIHTVTELVVWDNERYSLSREYYQSPRVAVHHFYSFESIQRFIQCHNLKPSDSLQKKDCDLFTQLEKQLFDYKNIPEKKLRKILHSRSESVYDYITRKIFEVFDGVSNDCPILCLSGYSLTKYPRLANYQFGKVVPPQEAYNELYKWFSNKAVPLKPMPTVDDKTMLGIKGFDKWSFKKEPVKHK